MSEIVETRQAPMPNNPFAKAAPEHLSAGAVAIESERAVAEAQGRLLIAKRFPRDQARAFNAAMLACQRLSLAEVALYRFPRAGASVEGPSIRLAEELARCWGNIAYGIRELSRRPGESEMEAFAWDQETNVLSTQTFTVRHIRDTRGGGKALSDERDIYEVTANMGARRLRARILAVLPPDLVDAAEEQCRQTVIRGGAPKEKVDKVVEGFARIGVNLLAIEARLNHAIKDITPDEFAELRTIYAAIKDGAASVGEHFPTLAPKAEPATGAKLDAMEKALSGGAAGK